MITSFIDFMSFLVLFLSFIQEFFSPIFNFKFSHSVGRHSSMLFLLAVSSVLLEQAWRLCSKAANQGGWRAPRGSDSTRRQGGKHLWAVAGESPRQEVERERRTQKGNRKEQDLDKEQEAPTSLWWDPWGGCHPPERDSEAAGQEASCLSTRCVTGTGPGRRMGTLRALLWASSS